MKIAYFCFGEEPKIISRSNFFFYLKNLWVFGPGDITEGGNHFWTGEPYVKQHKRNTRQCFWISDDEWTLRGKTGFSLAEQS